MRENEKEGREGEQKNKAKCTEGKQSERTRRERERYCGSGKMSQQKRES